ncbi:MAG: hypothetical protein JWO63_2983 [Frankiales bacterium]|nr:hypothetical protein [Frankiales bacterium]
MTAVEAAPLPPRIATLLQEAHAAELIAVGSGRRVAWRTTRQVLGAVLEAGYATSAVADCLRISAGEVRARATADGWLADSTISALTGFSSEVIAGWHDLGLLPTRRLGPGGRFHYPAADVVDLLASVRLNPTISRHRFRRGPET